jgi:hypothetical protein
MLMGPAAETLQLVLLIAAGSWVARRFTAAGDGSGDGSGAAGGAPDGRDEVVVTADGRRFLPDDDGVQILPAGDLEHSRPVRGRAGLDWSTLVFLRGVPVDPRGGRPLPSWKPGERLDPGDLLGARVMPGESEDAAWRLEALGRDRDYRAWAFEGEETARAALALVERRVVRRPWGGDGRAWPPAAADFERALRELLETEQALWGTSGEWTHSMAGGDWLLAR